MLDINTLTPIILLQFLFDSLVLFIIWRTQKELVGLGSLTAGFLACGIGVGLQVLRVVFPSPYMTAPATFSMILGQVLITDGFSRFLGQPRRLIIGIACVVFTAIFWPVIIFTTPNSTAIRIVVGAAVSAVPFVQLAVAVANDRTQPALLRRVVTSFLLGHVFVLLLRIYNGLTVEQREIPAGGAANALFWFEVHLLLTFLFLSFVLMISFRLASDLRRRNEALAEALRNQKQFVDMLSHEFRSPLVVVDRAAEMLGDLVGQAGNAVTQRLARIRGAAQRLTQMIEQMLTVERLDHYSARLEMVDVMTVLDDVLQRFEDSDHAGRLVVSAQAEPVICHADREMLGIVLANVIDNALKYSPSDTPVEIRLQSNERECGMAVVDRGVGIPAEEIESIGRRFYRATTAGSAAGTGLGLYTVRRLVELNGGRFAIESERGSGTRVQLHFPQPAGVPRDIQP